jgi:nickel/cobalt exporter
MGFLLLNGAVRAHPLGNFTISRFSGLQISADAVSVHYAVDMAEIPTFQEIDPIDSNGDEALSTAELEDYAEGLSQQLLGRISVTVDGRAVELEPKGASARLAPGQGGLQVLRVDAFFTGPLSSPEATVTYEDRNYPGRIGWKEVVASADGGQGIESSTVPARSLSGQLRSYPRDRLASPPDVTSATVEVSPSASAPARVDETLAGPTGRLGDSFPSLIQQQTSPGLFALAVLLALGFGALHALAPGHGKTIMAAYLVGAEGKIRHAVTIGIAVSLMHTASVVVLGLITVGAATLFPPEAIYPWLSLASGIVVLGLGLWLLWTRLPGPAPHTRRAHTHHHAHRGGHAHARTPSHGPIDRPATSVSPFSPQGLAAVALSGGLLPSPTAIVVLLGAVALHRIAFGVVLVGAFSIGLAAALTAVGILVLRARTLAAHHLGHRVTALLPALSAAAIVTVGLWLTTRAAINL